MPDYRRRFRPPAYTRLLGAARRARFFEPAYFELLEERLQQLEGAGSAAARFRARAGFQRDVLLLALDCLRLSVPSAGPPPEPRAPLPVRERLGLWLRDARLAARGLGRAPAFTLVAAATLALGIGANTAIFSVLNAVMLRPLPYREPERLVLVAASDVARDQARTQLSFDAVADFRDRSRAFEGLVGLSPRWSLTLRTGVEPERIFGFFSSAGTFEVLGVRPLLGRTPTAAEDRAGAAPVAVLGYGLWQRRFGGDPSVIGRTLNLDRVPVTVVGVLPPDFRFLEEADVWLPLAHNPFAFRGRGVRLLTMAGRLRGGVTVAEARAELSGIAEQLSREHPDSDGGLGIALAPIREELIGPARPLLLAVAGAVALVLLIACANVANLLLARAAARRQALAVRAALGASGSRLVRELMAESLLLALLGGAAGAVLAAWGVRALAALAPATLPRRDEIAVDGTVLLFTLGASLVTALVFGLVPALHAARVDVAGALRMRGSGLAEGRRLRNGLVVAEVALSVMVVVAAVLLVRSFARLRTVDPGIEVENVVSMDLSELPSEAPRRVALMEELYGRLGALPGVIAAGDVTRLPLAGVGGNPASKVVVEGRPVPPGQEPQIDFRRASRGYFRTMGVPLLAGRVFSEAERLGSDAPPAVVINEAAADWLFPGEDPLGRRLQLSGDEWYTIVGVVGNVRHLGLHARPRPEAYIHALQGPPNNPQVVVRMSGDPASMVAGIRSVVRSVDPGIVVARVATMKDVRDESLAGPRFNTALFGVFAVLALVLGVVGVYGVLAYTVAQRTAEIGVRMALGARAGDVLRLVVGHGLALAGAGVLLGVVGALVATRLLRGLLFEVSPTDPPTFGAAVLLLLAAALLASSVPAWRAARVDPLETLRHE